MTKPFIGFCAALLLTGCLSGATGPEIGEFEVVVSGSVTEFELPLVGARVQLIGSSGIAFGEPIIFSRLTSADGSYRISGRFPRGCGSDVGIVISHPTNPEGVRGARDLWENFTVSCPGTFVVDHDFQPTA